MAQALVGFERTISLTTHLLLHGEVITQSPAAKGFHILAAPFEEGSWVSKALLTLGGGTLTLATAAGVAPPETAFGWLAKSAVEYVIEESLGFQPNFEETLGEQIRRHRVQDADTSISDDLTEERFDSLIEKVEPGLKSIHRPLIKSESAETAQVDFRIADTSGTLNGFFSPETFQYIDRTITSDDFDVYCGNISSYNTNTFKGRIYLPSMRRTIPFELSEVVRNLRSVDLITASLRSNGRRRVSPDSSQGEDVCFEALRNESVNGRLKSLFVTTVGN